VATLAISCRSFSLLERSARAYPVLLEPEEVGKRYKHNANGYQDNVVPHKIRKDNKGEPTYERDDGSLLLAIDEEAKSY
jgi:hypothetical protein